MPESLFWCCLVNFTKFVRTTFLQNSTRWLLLNIALVVKGVLANETVNYDTEALREKCPNSKSWYYRVNLRIQSEYWKKRTRKNSTSGNFSRSESKEYVLIFWGRSVIFKKGESSWKNRLRKQSFADLKLGVLKNFVNFTGKNLCRSLFLINLLA